MPAPRLYLVTDRRLVPDLPAAVAEALAALPPGAAAVQLREKDLSGRALLELARALLPVCRSRRAPLLVNDRADVALAAGAGGVHLPEAGLPVAEARRLLGPSALVGASCHGLDSVRRARDAGADFATFGPVFDTPSKRGYGPPVGLAALREASALGLPLVALGGLDAGSARSALAAGALGIAAIRAWLEEPDRAEAARRLLGALP